MSNDLHCGYPSGLVQEGLTCDCGGCEWVHMHLSCQAGFADGVLWFVRFCHSVISTGSIKIAIVSSEWFMVLPSRKVALSQQQFVGVHFFRTPFFEVRL